MASESTAVSLAGGPAGQSPSPSPSAAAHDTPDWEHLQKWKDLTNETQTNPYYPQAWIERAEFYLQVKFYELACADAHKAHILCDVGMREKLSRSLQLTALGPQDMVEYRENAAWISYVALRELGAVNDAMEFFPEIDGGLLGSEALPEHISPKDWTDEDKPELARNRYPWLDEYVKPRNVDGWRPQLTKKDMSLKKASFAEDEDVLSMYTEKERHKDDLLFSDRPETTALPNEVASNDEEAMFLVAHMVKVAAQRLNSSPATFPGLLRLNPTNTLTASYQVPKDNFSFKRLIEDTAAVLIAENLLFDKAFDSWRIFTLYWRLCTNCFTQKFDEPREHRIIGIAGAYAFFNHSCRPNAGWLVRPSASKPGAYTMEITASRYIRPGGEVFISYLADLERPLEERRKDLYSWFGANCLCSKCVEEEKQQNRASLRASASHPRPRRERAEYSAP